MPYKAIMNIIPMVQSAQLLGENIKVSKKEKIGTKDMLGLGIKNITGVSIIQAESQLIGGL